jgi:hypothetical protein
LLYVPEPTNLTNKQMLFVLNHKPDLAAQELPDSLMFNCLLAVKVDLNGCWRDGSSHNKVQSWALDSTANYQWLSYYGECLNSEYAKRIGKMEFDHTEMQSFRRCIPLRVPCSNERTKLPTFLGTMYVEDLVTPMRLYVMKNVDPLVWTKQSTPSWYHVR